jgi:hypothetical protein
MKGKRKKLGTAAPLSVEIERSADRGFASDRGAKTRRGESKVSYVLDLKVNSPSTNGFLNMDGLNSGPAIVRLAKVKGLDVIAITDLYSGAFIDELVSAAQSSPLTVIPGVSLRCRVGICDDIIISCLFPEKARTADISNFLRNLQIPIEAKGDKDFIVSKTLDEILYTLEQYSGVAIPTRVDKTPTRLSVLAELVETYGFRAFDLAYCDSEAIFTKRWPNLNFQLFSFSDAYGLAQIGSRSAKVKLPIPGFEGIRQIVARA